MELAFAHRDLRQLCENEAKATGTYGREVAAKLRARLADLRAIDTFGELAAGRPKFQNGEITVDLCDGYIIVVAGNHVGKSPSTHDWKAFERIKILRIAGP